MYEMVVTETDFPFVGAANIFVPLIPTQLESLLSYVAAKALVPRFILVKGLTDDACKSSAKLERYYNSELRRQRGDTSWYQQLLRWLHLALRDGTAYMEAVWKYRKNEIKVNQRRVKMEQDPDTGSMLPVPDPQTGQPQYEDVETTIEDVHNDVELRPRPLREIITVPASARSVQAAVAVVAVDYLYEDQLTELVEGGVLDADEVEMALQMVPSGSSELPTSPQPTGIYEAGRQIGLGAAQGTQASKFFRNRGPIEVYRVHTRQYDLDHDGRVEENVVWVQQSTWRMLGWMRYNYLANLGGAVQAIRPFFPFAPFERPGELIGFGVPDRLAGLQNEANAQRNQRLNEGTIRIAPPWWENRNATIEDDNFSWGPNQKIRSDSFEDIRRYDLPPIPQQAYLDEQQINQDANQYTGLSSVMPRGGRRSATEAKQDYAATSMRLDMIVMNFRFAARTLVNFIHELKRQFQFAQGMPQSVTFATQSGQRFELTAEEMAQEYLIDISGASDPMDAASRRQEELAAYEIFMKDPDIAQNPLRRYYLRRKLAETFDWADIDNIIGTEQDAQQMVQAQQAQAMLQHVQQTIHGPGAGGAQNGQPPGTSPQPLGNSPLNGAAQGQVA